MRVDIAREGLDLEPRYALCEIGALRWDPTKPFDVIYGAQDSQMVVGSISDLQREESGVITAEFQPLPGFAALQFDKDFTFMTFCSSVIWSDELVEGRRVITVAMIRSVLCILNPGFKLHNGVTE